MTVTDSPHRPSRASAKTFVRREILIFAGAFPEKVNILLRLIDLVHTLSDDFSVGIPTGLDKTGKAEKNDTYRA
ncbi:MAG: hypothetical protein ACOY99_12335 [Pseudomonadota bacterium]